MDVSKLKYHVDLLTETGSVINLSNIITELVWESQDGELAQRASISLVNFKTELGYIMGIIKLNCKIYIYAVYEGNRTLVFYGSVWDWNYVSAEKKELSITAYDPTIYLKFGKDSAYFPAGRKTSDFVTRLCNAWETPCHYDWLSITHGQVWSRDESNADLIIKLLNEAKDQLGEKYVIFYKDGQVNVKGRGTNADIYHFTASNVISTSNRLTMDGLITNVVVIHPSGSIQIRGADQSSRTEEFGVLQDLVTMENGETLKNAMTRAQNLLKENNKPKETISVNSPDVPFIGKGDKVKITAGNLDAYFFVLGITHNATTKTMNMELEREE